MEPLRKIRQKLIKPESILHLFIVFFFHFLNFVTVTKSFSTVTHPVKQTTNFFLTTLRPLPNKGGLARRETHTYWLLLVTRNIICPTINRAFTNLWTFVKGNSFTYMWNDENKHKTHHTRLRLNQVSGKLKSVNLIIKFTYLSSSSFGKENSATSTHKHWQPEN